MLFSRGDILYEVCSLNAIRMMVEFSNLSNFFDLRLTINKFIYFFKIDYKDGMGQLRSRHKLFDSSSKGNQDWAKDTLEVSGSPTLRLSSAYGLPSLMVSELLHSWCAWNFCDLPLTSSY